MNRSTGNAGSQGCQVSPHPPRTRSDPGAGAVSDNPRVQNEIGSCPYFVVRYRIMGKLLVGLFIVFVCLGMNGCDSAPAPANASDSLGRSVPASVTNDAELLVYRCGKPDKVLDTSEDDPRPPIPSRIMTYQKAHLKIAYIPGGPFDQPPPYHWKIMGVIDTRTNTAVSADKLQSTLQSRLPCMLANPKR